MSDHIRSMARTQVNGFGAYHIRLDVDQPDFHRASRLLRACGGCEVVEAAGMVYRFITFVARDNALHLLRSKIGYTVAIPFDGRPWWSGDSASRDLRISSQEARQWASTDLIEPENTLNFCPESILCRAGAVTSLEP